MKKYEAVIILNPNLSTKAESFLKEFKSLLSDSSFNIIKTEDVGRRQLAYSINNHNKGHYLLLNIEGDPTKLIDIENKIKYNESIIRYLFISKSKFIIIWGNKEIRVFKTDYRKQKSYKSSKKSRKMVSRVR